MRSQSHSNALLVELMIVVAFFMLSAVVLMKVFSAARLQGEKADLLTDALVKAQNVAERIYAAGEPEDALAEMGFSLEEGIWKLTEDNIITEVTLEEEVLQGGVIERQQVKVTKDDEDLIVLPAAKYREVQP